MTYKEAISLFETKYNRLSHGKDTYKMSTQDILAELSLAQTELNDLYHLSNKSITVTLIAGTSTYATATTDSGRMANQLPMDILKIQSIKLNDNSKTILTEKGESAFGNTTKATGKPYYYTLYKDDTSMILELDTYPDSNYIITILYTAKLFPYSGSTGVNTNPTWSDLNFSSTGYGGSLKLPEIWHRLVIDGALANIFPELYPKWKLQINEMLKYNTQSIGKSELPAYSGISLQTTIREIPGQDEIRA